MMNGFDTDELRALLSRHGEWSRLLKHIQPDGTVEFFFAPGEKHRFGESVANEMRHEIVLHLRSLEADMALLVSSPGEDLSFS